MRSMPQQSARSPAADTAAGSCPVLRDVVEQRRSSRIICWVTASTEGAPIGRRQQRHAVQTHIATNAPRLLKAVLVDNQVELGVMASGQVVGMIDDLPHRCELIGSIVEQANDIGADLAAGGLRPN
jgi:NAD(P)H-dependent flavin oxidoreductase YrpB (nitropropane dioxygenase family)